MTEPDLIARLEAATEGSGGLDIEIFKIVDAPTAAPGTVLEYKLDHEDCAMWRAKHPPADFGSWWHMPAYTTSLDAALSLVPEGAEWRLNSVGRDGRFDCHLEVLVRGMWTAWGTESATPALALCIAALRARSAQ